jgi:hypothetical protein
MNIEKSGGNPKRHSSKDLAGYELSEKAFQSSKLPLFDKLEAFPRFSTKRSLARFLCKHEIFKQIININGVIIECGVFNGAGLFTWAQLSNIYEPTNYNRKVIGFDTFEGFPSVAAEDFNKMKNPEAGDLLGEHITEFSFSIEKFEKEYCLSHLSKLELIKGDFMETGENYLNQNKHILISLLYLDFDLYEPTRKALELFIPRMSKGAVLCFDQLNCENFPGETQAILEYCKLSKYELRRTPIDPWISWIVL